MNGRKTSVLYERMIRSSWGRRCLVKHRKPWSNCFLAGPQHTYLLLRKLAIYCEYIWYTLRTTDFLYWGYAIPVSAEAHCTRIAKVANFFPFWTIGISMYQKCILPNFIIPSTISPQASSPLSHHRQTEGRTTFFTPCYLSSFFFTERAGPYPQAQLYWAGRTMGWMADEQEGWRQRKGLTMPLESNQIIRFCGWWLELFSTKLYMWAISYCHFWDCISIFFVHLSTDSFIPGA
jgi:hypothetical protein